METNTPRPPRIAPPRLHLTVLKWQGHREVGYFTPREIERKIFLPEIYGDDGLRDMDCSGSCWCVEEGSYDHFKDILA
jgi:hypothetical protein